MLLQKLPVLTTANNTAKAQIFIVDGRLTDGDDDLLQLAAKDELSGRSLPSCGPLADRGSGALLEKTCYF